MHVEHVFSMAQFFRRRSDGLRARKTIFLRFFIYHMFVLLCSIIGVYYQGGGHVCDFSIIWSCFAADRRLMQVAALAESSADTGNKK